MVVSLTAWYILLRPPAWSSQLPHTTHGPLVQEPAHYVAFDRKHRRIVVCIRCGAMCCAHALAQAAPPPLASSTTHFCGCLSNIECTPKATTLWFKRGMEGS